MENPENNNKLNWFTEVFAVLSLAVGAVAFVVLLVFVHAVVNAFVLSTLWQWYIVEFFNQPPLPLAVAFGIGLLYSALKGMNVPKKNEPKADGKMAWVPLILFPACLLAMGWAGTWFM